MDIELLFIGLCAVLLVALIYPTSRDGSEKRKKKGKGRNGMDTFFGGTFWGLGLLGFGVFGFGWVLGYNSFFFPFFPSEWNGMEFLFLAVWG